MPSFDLSKLDEVVEIIKEGNEEYWNKSKCLEALQSLDIRLSKYMNVKEKKVIIDKEIWCNGACLPDKLVLNKASLITFLHEFMHDIVGKISINTEISARIISNILFENAYPERYRNLVLKDGILYSKGKFKGDKMVKPKKFKIKMSEQAQTLYDSLTPEERAAFDSAVETLRRNPYIGVPVDGNMLGRIKMKIMWLIRELQLLISAI